MMWSESLCLLLALSYPNQIASSAQTRLSFIKRVYSIEHSEAHVSPEALGILVAHITLPLNSSISYGGKSHEKYLVHAFLCVYKSIWHGKMPQKILQLQSILLEVGIYCCNAITSGWKASAVPRPHRSSSVPPGPTRSICSKNAGRTQPAQPCSFPLPSPCRQTTAGRAQLSQLDPGQDDQVNNLILAGTVTVYLLIPNPSPPQHLGAPAGTKPAPHAARLSVWGRAGPRRPG